VTDTVQADPKLLSLGQDFTSGDNRQAMSLLTAMQDAQHPELGDMTVHEHFNASQSQIGGEVRTKEQQTAVQENVLQGLEYRRESISGVNLDEELLNLNRYQTAYQASARLVQTVNEMMGTILRTGV